MDTENESGYYRVEFQTNGIHYSYVVKEEKLIIGRGRTPGLSPSSPTNPVAQLAISDLPRVSKEHAIIEWADGRWVVRVLSRNGLAAHRTLYKQTEVIPLEGAVAVQIFPVKLWIRMPQR